MSSVPERSIDISDAVTQLSRLITEVESGNEITLNRNGLPVARLVPYRAMGSARKPGLWKGKVSMSPDFDRFTRADTCDWYGE